MGSMYSIEEATAELSGLLGQAPLEAVQGDWTATVEMAGSSFYTGSYLDVSGRVIDTPRDRDVGDEIRTVRDRLEADADLPLWNTLSITWSRAAGVSVRAWLDPEIVPRGAADPVYEQAAAARRLFWAGIGTVRDGFLAEAAETNDLGQTDWCGPHRRIIVVERGEALLLATDGLSTPWAGVAERENGVGLEVVLVVEGPLPSPGLERLAVLLRNIGDDLLNGGSVLDDIAVNGPTLPYRVDAEWSPLTQGMLSLPDAESGVPRRMPGLPFGDAGLLMATLLTEDDLAGLSFSGDACHEAGPIALARHRARVVG